MSIMNGFKSKVTAINEINVRKLRQRKAYKAIAVAQSDGITVIKLSEDTVASNWSQPAKRKVGYYPWENSVRAFLKCLVSLNMISQSEFDSHWREYDEQVILDQFASDKRNLAELGEKYKFSPTPIHDFQAIAYAASKVKK